MTEHWHRTSGLVGLPGMPGKRSIQLHGTRRGWLCRERIWGKRTILEWAESSLPAETQAALAAARDGCGSDFGTDPHPAEQGPGVSAPAPSLISETPSTSLADARVEVIVAFKAWRKASNVRLVNGCRQFADLWKDGAVGNDETRVIIKSFHWSSLQRWYAGYHNEGRAALIAGSGGRTGLIDANADMASCVAALIFERPHHITARQIQEVLRVRFPEDDTPSLGSVRRYMRRFRREHGLVLDAVADPDGHRSRNLPAFGQADAGISRLNELWEMDSTPADMMCTDGKRYAIIGCIDVWSRRCKFLVAPTSCATAIAGLLRRCLLDWGVPETIRTDEGSDYTSQHIRRVIVDLDVEHDQLPPFSPDKKPFIERVFRTLSHDLIAQLPGFVGHNVADRKKIEGKRSFWARMGLPAAEMFECALTPEELQHRLDQWSDAVYARRPHSGLNEQTPWARAQSWTEPVRRIEDARALDMLLAAPAGDGWRTVGKAGISYNHGRYVAAELGLHMRRRVQIRLDPADYGRLYVFDEAGAYLCVAEDAQRTGVDLATVAAQAKAKRKQADKQGRAWARELSRTQTPANAIYEVLDHAAEAAGTVVALPKQAQAHETDGVAAARAAVTTVNTIEDAQIARADKLVEFYRKEGKL